MSVSSSLNTTSASSGLFTPYNHHDSLAAGQDNGGDLGLADLVPAGTELSRLAGLGLDSLDTGVTVTRYEDSYTYSISYFCLHLHSHTNFFLQFLPTPLEQNIPMIFGTIFYMRHLN